MRLAGARYRRVLCPLGVRGPPHLQVLYSRRITVRHSSTPFMLEACLFRLHQPRTRMAGTAMVLPLLLYSLTPIPRLYSAANLGRITVQAQSIGRLRPLPLSRRPHRCRDNLQREITRVAPPPLSVRRGNDRCRRMLVDQTQPMRRLTGCVKSVTGTERRTAV